MPPDTNKRPRPSVDGIRPPTDQKSHQQPEYRFDHELPAPEPVNKITAIASSDNPSLGHAVSSSHHWSRRKKFFVGLTAGIGFIIAVIISAVLWYQYQLSPVSNDTSAHIRVSIESGSAPSAIAKQLKQAGVIRSEVAFAIYTKLTTTQNTLKAGVYSLQPSLSTPAIVDHLVNGKQDTFHLTFLPGDTLANNRQKIIAVGYSEAEVDAALAKTYDRPLFEGKPAGTDLEGYIFGDTYEFDASATVETILERTFDEYEAAIKENDLVTGFKKRGLTLYQGITLSSIIQKEVSDESDSRQVAQVFLKRLADGMPLGADATFVYAAKKAGQQPSVAFDSPYNTRIHAGLPPGPISVPGIIALKAVADPAPGDYLYFVSGDDGKTYFSRTAAEHDANTRTHCIKNCSLF